MIWFPRYNDLNRMSFKELLREELRIEELLEGLGEGSLEDEIAAGLEERLKVIRGLK